MKELHAIISGKVQGVFFRAWTRETAQQMGLSGWVRNLPDGSVEALAQGEKDQLEAFLQALDLGAPLSRVSRVDSKIRALGDPCDEFLIRR